MIRIVLFSVQIFLITAANKWDCADYYWRDFHGTLPKDAIPAGTDAQGNTLYVSLAYIRGYELLPATFFPKQGVARTTAYALVFNTSHKVKILCSPYKEAFEWIATESKHLKDYTNRNLIPGGSEVGENLYIGRIFRDNSVIVGKVFRDDRDNRGLWYPDKNQPANSLNYELLAYNCDNVDVRFDNVKARAYYWRDFDGSIPQDAVPGGKHSNQTTYIGQALVRIGLLPTNIFPGVSLLKVPHSERGLPTAVAPKILCSDNEHRFVWLNVTSETLHTSTMGKHLVVGGYEERQKIYIGRVMYEGELIVGKVIGFNLSNIKMYFVYQDQELGTTSFQVMTYIP